MSGKIVSGRVVEAPFRTQDQDVVSYGCGTHRDLLLRELAWESGSVDIGVLPVATKVELDKILQIRCEIGIGRVYSTDMHAEMKRFIDECGADRAYLAVKRSHLASRNPKYSTAVTLVVIYEGRRVTDAKHYSSEYPSDQKIKEQFIAKTPILSAVATTIEVIRVGVFAEYTVRGMAEVGEPRRAVTL
jgi:hypothetical protein